MYYVYVTLENDGHYQLCRCVDLLSLWAVIEALIGEGAWGQDDIRIIRRNDGEQPSNYIPRPH
jgi:hypothetical protein